MPNTNFQTIHQMGGAINSFVKQATGRDNVQNIDMEHITVAQNHYYEDVDISGSVVSFNAGAAGIPLEKCLVQIEPVQDLHGQVESGTTPTSFAPYSNICPISGWTGAKVTRTGKNLVSNVTDKPNSGSVLYGYYGYPSGAKYGYPMIDKLFKAGTYTVSMDVESSAEANRVCIWVKKSDGEIYRPSNTGDLYPADSSFYMPFTVYSTGTTTNRITASLKINEDVIGIYFGYYSYGASKEYSNLQIEIGDISAYEPYSGSTAEYEFPQEAGTVYGGTLDVTAGTLTVDRAMVDLGTLNWTKGSGTNGYYYADVTGIKQVTVAGSTPNWLSSQYTVTASRTNADWNSTTEDKVVGPRQTTPYVCVVDSAYANADAIAFKAAMSGVQLVYELATPLTYTLTPHEVRTLLGQNNIWADTGDIEVKFTDIRGLY